MRHQFKVNDVVSHVKEPDSRGKILEIDTNLPDPTTCVVEWEDGFKEVQWTNKLRKVDDVDA